MSVSYTVRRLAPVCLSLLVASTSSGSAFAQSSGMSKKEEIHQVLYRIYKQQRNYDLAEKEVAALTAINPNNALIQQDIGRTLIAVGKWREALPHWLKATKSDPSNGDYWACLGDCYMQLQNYGAAGGPYTKAIQFQRSGTDYRPRYQIYQQYMDHIKQEKEYKKQLQLKKEDSDE